MKKRFILCLALGMFVFSSCKNKKEISLIKKEEETVYYNLNCSSFSEIDSFVLSKGNACVLPIENKLSKEQHDTYISYKTSLLNYNYKLLYLDINSNNYLMLKNEYQITPTKNTFYTFSYNKEKVEYNNYQDYNAFIDYVKPNIDENLKEESSPKKDVCDTNFECD